MFKRIKERITAEIVFGYIFTGFAVAHYLNDNQIGFYGNLTVTWILFSTDAILQEIKKNNV